MVSSPSYSLKLPLDSLTSLASSPSPSSRSSPSRPSSTASSSSAQRSSRCAPPFPPSPYRANSSVRVARRRPPRACSSPRPHRSPLLPRVPSSQSAPVRQERTAKSSPSASRRATASSCLGSEVCPSRSARRCVARVLPSEPERVLMLGRGVQEYHIFRDAEIIAKISE